MISGLLLLTAALFLTCYNLLDSRRAGEAAESIMQQLDIAPELRKAPKPLKGYYAPASPAPVEMPVQAVDGLRCIGVLEVPYSRIKLPVVCDCDYEKLEQAPCVYTGTYHSGDLVICGHNYPSHFAPLKYVPLGEDVYLTTVDGYVYHYEVDNVETVQPTAIEQMITADDWDLTLFTCHNGGQTRCAVRCVLIEE